MAETGTPHDAPDPGHNPPGEPADSRDRAAMRRLALDDDTALDELMLRHAGPLTGYLERLTGERSSAEDLAQETFVRLYQARLRFRHGRAFAPWLYTIATNLARDHFRWRSRHSQVSLDQEDTEHRSLRDSVPDSARNPSNHALHQELAAAVRQAVLELAEDLRTPLVLAEYQDLRVVDIADILGCSPKAVEMRLYRARLLLRERLRTFIN